MALPTSGDGVLLLNLIRSVCEPLTADPRARLDTVVRNMNMTRIRPNPRSADLPFGGWEGPFGAAPYKVTLVGQSPNNQQVCEILLDAPKDDAQILADAITAWSNLHQPFMALRRNDLVGAGGAQLRRFTWQGINETKVFSLNMNVETRPDGTSPFAGGDRIRVRFSVTPR